MPDIMDYDSLLPEIGAFGRYQKILICAVLIPTVFPCAFQAYSQLFIAATPKHWCHVEDLDAWAEQHPRLVQELSIPKIQLPNGRMEFDQCKMFNRNYTRLREEMPSLILNGSVDMVSGSFEVVPCKRGWLYDKSLYPSTVVSQVLLKNDP